MKNLGCSIFCLVIFVLSIIGISLGYKALDRVQDLSERVTSLEKSMVTIQSFTIKHDEIIYYNMLSLYQLANSPQEDIEAIKEMIKSRESLWAINYKTE